ncbi:MAG: nitrile hydratase accessory protein [Chloroflexota bacterium]
MMPEISQEINDMEDAIALPRKNGELQFEEPWEARAFGLAVALNEQGSYPWKSFSEGLAQEIAQTEAAGETAPYYENWLKTLEKLVIKNGLISPGELEARAERQAHEDNHDHDH